MEQRWSGTGQPSGSYSHRWKWWKRVSQQNHVGNCNRNARCDIHTFYRWKKIDGNVPPNVELHDYIDNMYAYWRSVDVAITRGGATTISELIHFNVPAVVIPWEGATEGHQVINAKMIENEGLGIMMREMEYSKDALVSTLYELIKKGRKFEERENPAKKIVESIIEEISKSGRI